MSDVFWLLEILFGFSRWKWLSRASRRLDKGQLLIHYGLLDVTVSKKEYYMYFTLGSWEAKLISSANEFDMYDFNEMRMSAMHM